MNGEQQLDPYPDQYTRFPFFVWLNDFGTNQGWLDQTTFQRHVGDVNGDGLNDIVGIGTGGVRVSFGEETPLFNFKRSQLVSTAFHAGDGFTTALADIDNDGRADLIGFGPGGVSVAFGQADGTFSDRTRALADFGPQQGWTSQDETLRLVGDFNGDGKADIIGFGYAGALVALGRGSGTFKAPVLGIADFGIDQGWVSDNIYHREVADVNGDGYDDIIGFGDPGVLVALSNGDGTFAPITLALDDFNLGHGWTSQDDYPRLVTDVNSDGFADIVGFGADHLIIAFGQSDGSFSDVQVDAPQATAAQGWTSQDHMPRTFAAFDLHDTGLNGMPHLFGFGAEGVYVAAHNSLDPYFGIG